MLGSSEPMVRVYTAEPCNQRVPAVDRCPARRGASGSQILDEAELVTFGIGHDDDDPFAGVVVALTGPPPAETLDLQTASVDVVDLDVEVEANLAAIWFGDALERESR